jgi:hypothetical protein
MTAFEHVILLLSFVYALALTHLLSGTAWLIRAKSRVIFSWFNAGWMANAFTIIFANWISFFDLRNAPVWTMGTILFVLGIAVSNYIQAALVCMDVPDEGPVDMAAFHASQARTYIAAAGVSVVFALLANVLLGGAFRIDEYFRQNLAVFPMLVACVIGWIWPRGWLQATSLIIFAAAWILLFTELQASLR